MGWMTSRDDVLKLGGRLLTKAVAEVVMGWRFETLDNGYGYPADYWVSRQGEKIHPANFWNPAYDLKDAWEVVEKMQTEYSWDMKMINLATEVDVRIGKGHATNKSVPHAICHAALLAIID